jgi:hypothetical protein
MMNYWKLYENIRKKENNWSSLVVQSSTELKLYLCMAVREEFEIEYALHTQFHGNTSFHPEAHDSFHISTSLTQ